MRLLTLAAATLLAAPAVLSAQVTSANFEATPSFVDTFSGGVPAFQWELDPGNLAGASAPSFATSTPAGIAASFVAANPVATATDGGVMIMGNDSSTAGTLFGLNYVIATNSESSGTGTAFSATEGNAFEDGFKMVARVWTAASSDLDNPASDRYQVGPYAFGNGDSTLFRPSIGHNAGSGGVAAGTNVRGFATNPSPATGLAPGGLTSGQWTLMSILALYDGDADQWNVSVGIDADGNGEIDETSGSNEFYTGLSINTTDFPATTFGFYTVGVTSNDVRPMFVDFVEVYLPAEETSTNNWELYN